MLTATSGKCDVVIELISLGADVDVQTNLVSHFLCLIMTLANGSGPPGVCFIHLSPELALEPRPRLCGLLFSRARAECNCVWANSAINGEGLGSKATQNCLCKLFIQLPTNFD